MSNVTLPPAEITDVRDQGVRRRGRRVVVEQRRLERTAHGRVAEAHRRGRIRTGSDDRGNY